jgi:hypothetical protein
MKLPRRGPGEDLKANRGLRHDDAQKAEQRTIERRLRHAPGASTTRADSPAGKGGFLLTHRNLFG